ETWIADVYRPFFGKSSSLGDDPMRNVLDRALQFDLDREEQARLGPIDEVLLLLNESDRGVRVGFIDADLLRRWREIIYERTAQELPWEHFRRFARRALPDHLKGDEQTLDSIVRSAPEMLARVKSHVSPEDIARFRKKSIAGFVKVAGEYLN
ncbi:MAG: hypothetical protein V3U26_03185, partial [Dehalococcoidia bacterium]